MGAPTTHTWWALYPANDNHVYTSDSDIKFYLPNSGDGSTARIPMIGKLESGSTYRFRQLCGAIKLNISNIRTEVSNVKVELNTHGWTSDGTTYKLVTGAFPIVDPGTSSPSISATQTSSITDGAFITSATAPVTSQSATVYIPIPAAEYWATVEFSVYDNDKNIRLFSKSFTSGQILGIERQKISRLTDLALSTVDRSSLIQADSYFEDWEKAAGVVSKSWPGSASVPQFDLKVVSDGANIWFYHKVYGASVDLSKSGYIELFLDTDGDSTTGDTSKWFAKGVDKDLVYYYSTSTGIPRDSFSFDRWENYNTATSSWSTGGDSPSVSWAALQDAVTKDMMFEWGTTLSALGLSAGSTVRFGFVLRSPQATSNDDLLSYSIPTP